MIEYLQSKIVAGALLLVACLGVGYFFTNQQWAAYTSAKAQVAEKQAQQQELNDAIAKVQAFVSAYKSRLSDVPTVNLALPGKQPDLPNLLSSIEEMAKASGVTLSNFQVTDPLVTASKPALENQIQTQKIDLVASGSYASFVNFITRLQSNLRLMDLDHVTVRADENGQTQYNINLRTYYQK